MYSHVRGLNVLIFFLKIEYKGFSPSVRIIKVERISVTFLKLLLFALRKCVHYLTVKAFTLVNTSNAIKIIFYVFPFLFLSFLQFYLKV